MSDRPEWDRCKKWIEDALVYAHGTHTIEDVESGIALGIFQFWSGKDSALVTEIITYPRMRVLNCWLMGGSLENLLSEIEPKIVEWAKHIGCTRIVGTGRKGFERALKSHGYEPVWFCLAKEL